MIDWWTETDNAILECLRTAEAMSPAELGQRVGTSEGETIAFLCMLARQGKVRIHLVGLNGEPASRTTGGTGRLGDGAVGSEESDDTPLPPTARPSATAGVTRSWRSRAC